MACLPFIFAVAVDDFAQPTLITGADVANQEQNAAQRAADEGGIR